MGISQYYPYTIPNKDPHNPHIIPIYPLRSLGYPLFEKLPCKDHHRDVGLPPQGYHAASASRSYYITNTGWEILLRDKGLGFRVNMGIMEKKMETTIV